MHSEWLRQLPYLVHTNRELGLMLRGIKPLAYFMDIMGQEPDICIRYWRMFDRHVTEGRLIRRELIETCPDAPQFEYRSLFYTLPGHEWQVDTMLALLNEPGAWSDDRERRFGELLGYESWQNDYWLTHGRSQADVSSTPPSSAIRLAKTRPEAACPNRWGQTAPPEAANLGGEQQWSEA